MELTSRVGAVPMGAQQGIGPSAPLVLACRLHFPTSKGRDLDWKPGRPQSPSLPAGEDQVPGAHPRMKLSGWVRLFEGAQVWTCTGQAGELCHLEPGIRALREVEGRGGKGGFCCSSRPHEISRKLYRVMSGQ